MNVATARCEGAPLKSMDQSGGIGLFIVPCVPYISLFIVEYCMTYCITLYFRGRKISRKVNLKYFREKIFSRIYCSRENIFPQKYLLTKISSRENIFPRKYPPAKIVCLFRQRSFLFAVCCPVIGDTGSRPNVRS